MPDRPNVIVFFTDQQRWDTTGVHHNPMNLTPNFDAMAQQGTHLSHAFTCQPVCLPARACLQTGRYATQIGAMTNADRLPRDARTLAHAFRDGGYATGYIGKWHMDKSSSKQMVESANRGGYEYWLAANVLEFCSDAYDCVMYDNENHPVKLPGYRIDAQTDAAIRFVDAKQHQPFFLFCSYLEPHFQNHRDDYPAPTGYAERFLDPWTPPDLRALVGSSPQHLPGYYGMVKRLDEALGRMLDALRSLNLLEKTIVLFASDHGCHFKTRNGEYKRSCHDGSIRIPAALIGPGFNAGGRIRELVSLVDLPATLLDACQLPPLPDMAGRSIMPLTRGDRADWPGDIFVQISESHVGRAIRTRRWKYSVRAPTEDVQPGSTSGVYREDCLYDLLADPYELNNLAGLTSHRRVAEVMRQRLIKRMTAVGEAPPVIHPAEEQPAGQKTVGETEAWG